MVIKCPNCNHYVSDTAVVCPNCGIKFNTTPFSKAEESNVQSKILERLEQRGDSSWSVSTIDKICAFYLCDHGVQISIMSSRKDDGNDKFQKAKSAYQRFKQSNYFLDFKTDLDNYKDDYIEYISNDFSEEGRSKIKNVNEFFADLLQNVFEITSLNQIQIEVESDISKENEDDSAGILMKILCFLLPIVGLVLYFVKRNSLPNAAKSYLIWAAAGFGLTLLVNLAS